MSSGVEELISTRTSVVDSGAFAPLLSTCAMMSSASRSLGAEGDARKTMIVPPLAGYITQDQLGR